jgi:hypothetical protein
LISHEGDPEKEGRERVPRWATEKSLFMPTSRFFNNHIIPWLADASIPGETPIRFLAGTKLLAPRRHRGGVGEPIVLEPTRIAVHPSVGIPESKRNLDAAAVLQPPRRYAAGVEAPFEQQPAPASSARSARPKTMQRIGEAIS